jgi:hypothetical protein
MCNSSQVTTEATADQKAIIAKLHQAASQDKANLTAESADKVRERLAKSQTVARNIMATLKLEREHAT